MRGRRVPAARGEAGFSMVEMLISAVILAVGILGVTLMQAMALKVARGGRSLTSGAQVAERLLDQVEMEGRLTWLNATDTSQTAPSAISQLSYINIAAPVSQYYDSNGQYVGTAAGNAQNFYTVTLSSTAVAAAAGAPLGGLSDFTAVVQWVDNVNGVKKPIQRSISLTRRIVHG